MSRANRLTLGADRALYRGELPATGWHRHAAPVFLLGLSGRFALHLGAGRIEHCHSALVDTGVHHAFDPVGESVALVYLEPDSPEAAVLRPLLRREGGVVFEPALPVQARSAADTRLQAFDLGALLRVGRVEPAPLDARIATALRLLRQPRDHPLARAHAAAGAHLSSSRFNHLFTQEVGVSFRSYRVWSQVRAAMAGMGPHLNLTEAALEGAFADSSHFSRSFRATFGMTPSSVLKSLARIERV